MQVGYVFLIGFLGSCLFGGGCVVGAGVGGVRLGGYGGKIAVIASAEGQGHIDETLLCYAVGIVVSVLRTVGLDFGNAVGHKEIFSPSYSLLRAKVYFPPDPLVAVTVESASP